jgi:cytochrome c biogenesis protein
MSEKMTEVPLGGVPLLRWMWRQLTSMRTALLLLMLLGIGSIPGSLFPQRTQNPMKVREYLASHGSLGTWLDRFRFFDVYSSPWFSAIYLLLFISLIGCVLPRTLEHLRAIGKQPPLTPRNLDRMEGHEPGYEKSISEFVEMKTLFLQKKVIRGKLEICFSIFP